MQQTDSSDYAACPTTDGGAAYVINCLDRFGVTPARKRSQTSHGYCQDQDGTGGD